MESLSKALRISLIQMKIGKNKLENITHACNSIRKTVEKDKPKVVALPECFNSPYGTKYFNEYAENIPDGDTSKALANIAKELNVFLIGGTIPERDNSDNKLYNTCTIWSPSGDLIAKYRKMHLFDIDVKGGIRFKESETLSAGNKLAFLELDGFKIGIGICYDIRFEELARIYRNNGCDMLLYPAAFNMTTGPLHWELLQRARANDLQLFVATVSPARDVSSEYVAWGHSMVVDPWAKIVRSAQDGEETIVADLDTTLVQKVREQIPVSKQRRLELYDTISKFDKQN
ncbi:omega-amidase NIT2 [Sitodiplosis mosellana]|uniref:omega-amidase NIT2 n=1 Tax=Sitodiplosis mosellana TaxID=263140 RepID=UPI0024443533|nr:omega-amidase NIT2 [Sitodiplosis mosellana]